MCMLLFTLGLYAVVTKKNLIKIAIGIALMEYSISLLLIMLGYSTGGHTPILQDGVRYVDPLAQAMVVSIIFVGLANLIFLTSVCVRMYEKYGTLDITEIRKLKG